MGVGNPVSIGYEAGWAPQLVQCLRKSVISNKTFCELVMRTDHNLAVGPIMSRGIWLDKERCLLEAAPYKFREIAYIIRAVNKPCEALTIETINVF